MVHKTTCVGLFYKILAQKRPQQHLQSNFSMGDYKPDYSRNEQNLGEGNKTSTKVHHAPGGQSNFSLGHDGNDVQPVKRQNQPSNATGGQGETEGFKPSVRVHNPPGKFYKIKISGGRSNITFG